MGGHQEVDTETTPEADQPVSPEAERRLEAGDTAPARSAINAEPEVAVEAAAAYQATRTGEEAMRMGDQGAHISQLIEDLQAAANTLERRGEGEAFIEAVARISPENAGTFDASVRDAVMELQTWQGSQEPDSAVWASRFQYSQADGVVGLRSLRTIESLVRPNSGMLDVETFSGHVARLDGLVSDMRQMGVNGAGIRSHAEAWQAYEQWYNENGMQTGEHNIGYPDGSVYNFPDGVFPEGQPPVPWISQYDHRRVPGAGDVACYRAARAMLAARGMHASESTIGALQIATQTRGADVTGINHNNLEMGLDAIRDITSRGGAVIMGVNHRSGSPNRDGMTDHYVVVHSVVEDPNTGEELFLAHDPATRHAHKGANVVFRRDQDGNLVRDGNVGHGEIVSRRQELTQLIFPSGYRPS